MTERKPAGMSFETWVERQVREAQERGEFDGLPGAGKPIPDLHRPHDELWWVKRKLERENLSVIPPVLAVRKQREDALERIQAARTEREVRDLVAQINVRIVHVNATATSGPPSNLRPLDVEQVVNDWRRTRARAGE